MLLSVIIPVFNEQKTIAALLKKVYDVPLEKEIIVVNDASTDDTLAIIESLAAQYRLRIFSHQVNQGKGAAIRTGISHISGDMLIIQDGDLETEPMDYLHLVQPIAEGRAAVVYGSRNLNPATGNRYWLYDIGGRAVSQLANILYCQRITDEAACYKVFRKDVIQQITLTYNRFEFCPEVTAKVSKLGYKIYELPMHYYPRSFAEGKKMQWTDGLKAAWVLIKFRFVD
jgi:dolichol-phosphate mannosyltransferase